MEAERELDHLKCELVTQNVGGNSKVKEDLQRRLREWEWKAHILHKIKKNYEDAGTWVENGATVKRQISAWDLFMQIMWV